ncbi:MAG: hypothetical protein RL547_715 [Actinomycetota bacterium]
MGLESEAAVQPVRAGGTVGVDVDHGMGESLGAVTMEGIDEERRRDAPAAELGESSQFVDRGRPPVLGVVGGLPLGEQERHDAIGRRVDGQT